MASEIKDKAIVLDLVTLMSEITIANGYKTDIGNDVRHWDAEAELADPEEVPDDGAAFINVQDMDGPDEAPGTNYHTVETEIEIRIGCVKKGDEKETWNFLKDAVSDVKKFIGSRKDFFLNKRSGEHTSYHCTFKPLESGILGIETTPASIGEAHVKISETHKIQPWLINEDETFVLE